MIMSRRLLFITGTFSIGVHCSRPPPPQSPSWNHKAVCTGFRWLSSKHSSLTCWNCGKLIHLPEDSVQFLCPCENGVILPPTTQNYFKIMGWYVLIAKAPVLGCGDRFAPPPHPLPTLTFAGHLKSPEIILMALVTRTLACMPPDTTSEQYWCVLVVCFTACCNLPLCDILIN